MAENYYELDGPGSGWAGHGRRQRHAQRQRARGAGMGALGETFGDDRALYQQDAGQALGQQREMYGTLGGLAGQYGAMGQQYADLASGRGPSLARTQLAQTTQQNIADAQSMAAQSRGGNLAAQARQAQAAGAAAQVGAQQQAHQLRAQEQLAAMQGQQQALGGQAGVYGQQAALANAMYGQAQAGQMGMADMQLQHQLGHRQLDVGAIEGRRAFATNLVGSILGGGGGAAGGIASAASMSDERVKQNIHPGGLAATQAVGELKPQTYEYRPGYGAPGERVGVMAQDLEKTPAGAALVMNTPMGKAVDVGGMASLGLAAVSEQQKRIEELERRLGRSDGKMVPAADMSMVSPVEYGRR